MARIKFKKGLQSRLLKNYFKLSGLSWFEIAKKLNISQRTLLDWRREKYTITQNALNEVKKTIGIEGEFSEYKVLPNYWSIKKAAKKGGRVVAEKYGGPGNPNGRKKGGINSQRNRRLHPELYQNCNLRKIIKIPLESPKLAEFIGLYLGDGGISNTSQITISFNLINGKDYCKKVKEMIVELFGIEPSVYKFPSFKKKNVIRLVVSSANLIDFLNKQNIKKGNKVKNQVDVPNWIKKDPGYSKNCLRGLVDTDGGVYYHRHSVNGVKSFNLGLCFTNKSRPLLKFVERVLTDLQFSPKISSTGDNVFLYRESEVLRYDMEVGFSNLYQRKRIEEYKRIKKRKGARVV